MIAITGATAALVALLSGAWLAVALWATWRGRRLAAVAREVLDDHKHVSALLGAGPAIPLLIARDGSLQGQDRLAGAFALDVLPDRWADFTASAALDPGQAEELDRCVVEAASGSGFSMALRPTNSAKVFRVEGGAAPPAFAERTVLLWFVDISEAEEQASALRARLERRSAALEALSRLLEARAVPDVAPRTRPCPGHGQQRLCRRRSRRKTAPWSSPRASS